MKKLTKLILSMLVVFAMAMTINTVVYADDASDFDYYANMDEGYVEITDYLGSNPIISIPETIEGLPVTKIGYYAFDGCSAVQITLPNTVQTLGDGAFIGCENLRSITMSTTISEMGVYVFEDCISLETAIIPTAINRIPDCTFRGCESLTSVTIPTNITQIGTSAFEECGSLTSVTIPNTVQIIEAEAFQYCSALTEVTIPQSVMIIGRFVFDECGSLSAINVSTDNAYYSSKDGVLFNNTGEKLIKYPQGNKRLEYEVPEIVTNIEEAAFYDCKFLQSVTITSLTCTIYDYYTTIPSDIVIRAYSESNAKIYAENNYNEFV